MEVSTLARGIPGKSFEPSLSSKYFENRSRNEYRTDSSHMIPYNHWSAPHTRNIKLIEATIRAWKADLSIQRRSIVLKADFDMNTVFEFPPKEVKDVSIRVHKAGRGKIEATFNIEDIFLIEPI